MTRTQIRRIATAMPAVLLFTVAATPLLGCDRGPVAAPPEVGAPLEDPTLTDEAAALAGGRRPQLQYTVTHYADGGHDSWTMSAPVGMAVEGASLELVAEGGAVVEDLEDLADLLASGDIEIDGDDAAHWQIGLDQYHLYRWPGTDLWTVEVLDCTLDVDVVDCVSEYRGVLATDFDLSTALARLADDGTAFDTRVVDGRHAPAGTPAAGTLVADRGAGLWTNATVGGIDVLDEPLVEPGELQPEGVWIYVAVIAAAIAVTAVVTMCDINASGQIQTVPDAQGYPVHLIDGSASIRC